MTTDYAAQHYQNNPQAERQALARLTATLCAVRDGTYEDPQTQMPLAAARLADAEFTATLNYAELLQHHADHSMSPELDRLAETSHAANARRYQEYAATICDPDIDVPEAVARLHQLCRDDFNDRMSMVVACPDIYSDSRTPK